MKLLKDKNKIPDVTKQFEEVIEDDEKELQVENNLDDEDQLAQAEQKVAQAQQRVDEAKDLGTADEVDDVAPQGWTVQQVATETREVFYNSTTGEQLELNQVLCKILNALEELEA